MALENSKPSRMSSATTHPSAPHPDKRLTDRQSSSKTVLLTSEVYTNCFFFQLWWQIIRVTDGRTDWRNDKVSYRVAITRLKILFSLIQILQLSIVEWTRTFEGFLIQVMPSFAEIGFFMALNIVQFTLQCESGFRMDKKL